MWRVFYPRTAKGREISGVLGLKQARFLAPGEQES
jgi:hypothetical protein